MSDAWNEIQALKSKQSNLRAKLAARRKEREGLAAELTKSAASPSVPSAESVSTAPSKSSENEKVIQDDQKASSNASVASSTKEDQAKPEPLQADPEVEKQVLLVLCDLGVESKFNSSEITEKTSKALGREVNIALVENLLQKFNAQQLISISTKEKVGSSRIVVNSVDLNKLSAVTDEQSQNKKRKRDEEDEEDGQPSSKQSKQPTKSEASLSLESLLAAQTSKERETKKMTEEILKLLTAQTAKERILVERFKTQGGPQLQEFCQYGTKEECVKIGESKEACKKLHFRKLIKKHTDESLGDCSFLNTCFHMDTCKYVHYEIDYPEKENKVALLKKEAQLSSIKTADGETVNMFPPQWIQCDLRYLDMAVLGKCAVIMADPPWDIHMELPYGTMSDDEMRRLPVPLMQDDGYMFLWVTGRAMELGRECLELWGYKRIDEIIWVKTNQLQRIIRTGRTGHWLNHGKEHCLIGVKGNPKGVNKGLDCDVIVAEVRATSHKPDEIYGIIERLSPGTRKVELFGRPHNVQPNWITLGNQLEGVRLVDPEIVTRFKDKYPDGNCLEPPKDRYQ